METIKEYYVEGILSDPKEREDIFSFLCEELECTQNEMKYQIKKLTKSQVKKIEESTLLILCKIKHLTFKAEYGEEKDFITISYNKAEKATEENPKEDNQEANDTTDENELPFLK